MYDDFEKIDGWLIYFPQPIRGLMKMFRQECIQAIKMSAKCLGFVSREDFMAQKQMLLKAREEIAELKKNNPIN